MGLLSVGENKGKVLGLDAFRANRANRIISLVASEAEDATTVSIRYGYLTQLWIQKWAGIFVSKKRTKGMDKEATKPSERIPTPAKTITDCKSGKLRGYWKELGLVIHPMFKRQVG